MNKTIITLMALAICISFAVPFLINRETNDAFVVGASLVQAIASVFTLVIAMLLYRKYGIESHVLSKNAETVFNLLEEIRRTDITFHRKGAWLRFSPGSKINYHSFWKEYLNNELLFSVNYMRGIAPVTQMAESIFLPLEISEKLRELRVSSLVMSENNDDLSATQFKVVIPGYKGDEINDKEEFGIIDGHATTFGEFLQNWQEVIRVSKKWLSEHSAYPIELNIE